jgi:hypothetical protein
VIRHLLGESLRQSRLRATDSLEGLHHFGTNDVLGWNQVAQVELERLLENMPLGLPIPFGKRNDLILKLDVDLRNELPGFCGPVSNPLRFPFYLPIVIS